MMFKYATRGGQNLFQLVDHIFWRRICSNDRFCFGCDALYLRIDHFTGFDYCCSYLCSEKFAKVPIMAAANCPNGRAWRRFLLALLQSSLYAKYAMGMNQSHPGIIVPELLDVRFLGFLGSFISPLCLR